MIFDVDREFGIRFDPPDKGSRVRIDVYAPAMMNVRSGLEGIRDNVAYEMASRLGLKLREVLDALTISIAPSQRGSLIEAIEIGADRPSVFDRRLQRVFWLRGTASLCRAARGGHARLVDSKTAKAFANAGEIAAKKNTCLQLIDRPLGGTWQSRVTLSEIYAPLHDYGAIREAKTMHTRVQLVGKIISVSVDPHSFRIKTTRGIATVRSSDRPLWDKAHRLLAAGTGGDVVVVADVLMSAENAIGEAKVVSLMEAVKPRSVLQSYLETRGTGEGMWSSDEAKEYLSSLRHKDED